MLPPDFIAAMNVRHLELDGCRLGYRISGAGPPVVLIQGVGVHGDGWLPQVEELSRDYRCLSFDNRGMGVSQPVGRALSVERMADDVVGLMDCEGWDSAHVVGHSLGGLIAVDLALRSRDRVRSLALLCTVARGVDATRMSRRMLWLGLRSAIGSRRMRRRAFLEIVLGPGARRAADPDTVAARMEPLFGHDLADRPPVAMKQLAALRRYDARAWLPRLGGVPTLVVSAEHDPIAPPRYGRELAAGIPGARFIEIEGASHGVTIEFAGKVNELLAGHIGRAEARSAVGRDGEAG